jgi:hypothetical protein
LHLWHVSARSRRLYLASSLRTIRRGLSAQCVSRPKYTRNFSGLFFAPEGHRLNVLVRRRAPAALIIACPLCCCIWPIMDHVAVWCGLAPSTIGDSFSSPVRQYFTRPFKESVVFKLGLKCIRVWWGVFTLILNRLPLCFKSTVFPL